MSLELDTTPPPSPEARALRAVGEELDVLGDAVTSLDAIVRTQVDMSATDHRTVVAKLDTIIAILTDPGEGLVARVRVLEVWRGDHAREHAQ